MFLHLPPEAIRNKKYDARSEIYSLGFLFWEMWYGKQAFSELKGHSLEEFLVYVEEGHRPQLDKLNTEIALKWSHLIDGCWKKDASKRRRLVDCASTINAILSG